MTFGSEKILLTRLYEKQSKTGRRYFVGRLGAARIVVLQDDRAAVEGATVAVWEVFAEAGDDGARPAARRQPASPAPSYRPQPAAPPVAGASRAAPASRARRTTRGPSPEARAREVLQRIGAPDAPDDEIPF